MNFYDLFRSKLCANVPNQLLRIMRLTIIIITLCLMQVNASSFAQKISISRKNVTLSFLFKEIRKQTGFTVLWQSEKIDETKTVDVNFRNTALETALIHILEGQNLTYTIKKNTIVLKAANIIPIGNTASPGAINGIVREKGTGNAIPGVSIKVEGTGFNGSTLTSNKGTYAFSSVSPGTYKVTFYYVGYIRLIKDVTIADGQKLVLDVSLTEDNVGLKQVEIKTGYQSIKKEKLTGAVEVLTAKDIVDKGYTSIEEAIKGKLAGITVASISGRPGAQAQIRIRGINSLTGDMNPIWIVDGMPLQGDLPNTGLGGTDLQNSVLTSGVGNIPPDDIESITVLKDAAAAAIYGSRAANGVIVVTTKRGRAGKSVINYQSSYSIDEAPQSKLQMMTGVQKVMFETALYNDFPHLNSDGRAYKLLGDVDRGRVSKEFADAELNRLKGINTDWYDEIFRSAHTQNHVISLSGGTEQTQFYASLNYLSQEGVMPNNKYNKLAGALKLTHDFNAKLRVFFDVYTNLRNEQTSASTENPLKYATYANPYEKPYNADGSYAYDRSYYSDLSAVKNDYKYNFNILEDLNNNTFTGKNVNNQMNLKLEYKIFNTLMFATQGTFSNTSLHGRKELMPGSFTSKSTAWLIPAYPEREITDDQNNGSLTENTGRSQAYTWRNQLNYAQNFKGKHFISAIVGQEMSADKSYSFRYYTPEFDPVYGLIGFPDLTGIDVTKLNMTSLSATTEQQKRSVSFFGTASYSFMDKYVVSGSYRLDGVDIIGTDNRFAPLWNVSFKYNLHNEEYLKKMDFINTLALRGSYGYTGSIDRNAYPFTLLKFGSSSYRYDGEKIPNIITPGNPSIKWQLKEDRSLGLDFALFNYRVNGTVNYYNNITTDLLDRKKVAISSGRDLVTANVASLNNSGWEFSLNTVNLDINKFRWTTSFNIALNNNKITETYIKNISSLPTVGYNTGSSQRSLVQGQPVNSWYGYEFAGIDPANGHTLAYINAKDVNGNPIGHQAENGRYVIDMDTEFTNKALQYLGEGYPPVTGGFGTLFNIGRFSLSAQFTFMTGHKINSFISDMGKPFAAAKYNQLASEQFRWREVGDVTTVPAYSLERTAYTTYFFSSQIEDGSFLKLNNVSLGYNLPQNLCSKIKLSNARVNLNVQNLFTATRYRGIDPETMGAFGYPSAKRFNLSLNIGI